MNKQKRERAEQRAEALISAPLSALSDFHITNYSGRFNAEDNVRIRISKDRALQDIPDIYLRISDNKIELGTNFTISANGKVKHSDERIWETIPEKDFSQRLQARCAELASFSRR